jgi:F5/8 type C domain
MRKRLITPESMDRRADDSGWLDLGRLCQAEITSEDAAHPVESALLGDVASGWRAARPGEQVIRLLFDEPQRLSRIRLVFREDERGRTQEFVLRWSPDGGRSYREVVRQQYTFSPPGTTGEVEDYGVDLDGVTVFELRIVPDIGGGDALASLRQLRLA